MPNPLFSTYSTGENRVTGSTMAVFERLPVALVADILQAASDTGDEFTAVTFRNQPVNADGVPDAEIAAGFRWLFETKIVRGAYATAHTANRAQIVRHVKGLVNEPNGRLFVLTPDANRPGWFEHLDEVPEALRDRVVWIGFGTLIEAARTLAADPLRVVDDRAKMLIAELAAFYEAEGLLSADDTVVVPARSAWDVYLQHAAYVCQANRSFKEDITHLAFYRDGRIEELVPTTLGWFPSVEISERGAESARAEGHDHLATVIRTLLAAGQDAGEQHGIMLLSPADDPRTTRLPHAVWNDQRSQSGRVVAWTQNQRYTRLDLLMQARVTSDLAGGAVSG